LAAQSGDVSVQAISSIEVVEPPSGHTPFGAKEYDGLPRHARILDPGKLDQILSMLRKAQRIRTLQNHPSNTLHFYLKVSMQEGFYWIYCDVYDDGKSSVLRLGANTLNGTNPNGAIDYELDQYSDLISILGAFRPAEAVPPSDGRHE
jgi:hypothetical protein